MASVHHFTGSNSGSGNACPLLLSLRPAPLKVPPRNPDRVIANPLDPVQTDAVFYKAHKSPPAVDPGPKRRSVASRLSSIISKFEMLDAVSSADAAPTRLPPYARRSSSVKGPSSTDARRSSASRHSIELSPYRVNPPNRQLGSSIGQETALLTSSGSPERPYRANKSRSELVNSRFGDQTRLSYDRRQDNGHQYQELAEMRERDEAAQLQNSSG